MADTAAPPLPATANAAQANTEAQSQPAQASGAVAATDSGEPHSAGGVSANLNPSANVVTEESMKARHAQEIAAIDADLKEKLSHVGKKNRKKKQALWAEANALTEDAKARHQQELADAGFEVVAKEGGAQLEAEEHTKKPKKKSKAQRRKERQAAEEKARAQQLRIEASNFVSGRVIEMRQLQQILGQQGLKVHDIPADGNCLYRAVSHQLSLHADTDKSTHSDLRKLAASHMKAQRSDYEPFFDPTASTGDGSAAVPQSFDEYCDDMATSARWGGQLELRALAEVTKRPIQVFSATSPVTEMGAQFAGDGTSPLRVSYHEQYYALGEHYNSVV